jgi:hypothetical protein
MRALDALHFWQEFIRQVGAPPLFAWAGIPSWPFHEDFMHI